jgi:argininosuccinate synthase
VVVRCYKGRAEAVKRRSPNSLFHHGFATFGEDEVYDHKHSEGFIRLFSLPLRIRALLGLNAEAKQLAAANKPGCGTSCGCATTKQHA